MRNMHPTNNPMVSIIVPCSEVDAYTEECINKCGNLVYSNYDVILLPDSMPEMKIPDYVRTVPTGNTTPGAKRNIGMKTATGDIFAFIDSDAYPARDWLKNALKYLRDPQIAAVGGPGITPDDDTTLQKAGGYVLSSILMGNLSKRYKTKEALKSEDIHSCNFIAKKSAINGIKWNEKFWPGEDTLFSLEIKKLKKKMLEAPDVVVYHHRKPLFLKHLKQVANFGLHRGFFAKKYPQTSRKLVYFLPTLFMLFLLICGVVAYVYPPFRTPLFIFIALYLYISFLSASPSKKLIPLVFVGVIATHIVYGLFFLMGLAKGSLKR